ncbi:MAG: MATE family efflux transporter [Planctomycetes bacterium]|nr:MATE family efflux transporter [Planctomycetota bacterium]
MQAPASFTPISLKALLTLAWPVVISRLSQTVITLSDAVMVAPLGEDAIAATTTGGLNAFLVMILPMGMVFLVGSFAAQLFGKGDFTGARRFGWYGLILAALTELAALATLPFIDFVVGLLGFSLGVQEAMTQYLLLRLLCAGPAIGIEALGSYFGGLGRTRIQMRTNLLAMGLNVALNWLLIYGNLGCPRLGVAGAALASTLATTIAFACIFALFLREARQAGSAGRSLSRTEFARLLRFGLPNGINWSFEFLAFLLFQNLVVGYLGTTALAAFGVVIALNSASFMPAFGISSAGAILVGQVIGAGRKDDVPRAFKITLATVMSWQGAVGLGYLLLPELLLRLMLESSGESADPELLTLGVRMLQLSCAWQLFDAAAMSLSEALRATGDTQFPMWARLAIAWGIFFPGSYLCVRFLGFGEVGTLLWLALYLALLSIALGWRFASGAWRKIELTETSMPLAH